ncbi:MAG: hypothetical protein IPL10_11660 [Bacteroidetes bacterium]|nr:hypothetical protein [Bacteroidota bacterium]
MLLTVPGGSVCTNLAPAPTLVSATTSTCAAPGCANFAGTAVDLWYKVVVPASGNLF